MVSNNNIMLAVMSTLPSIHDKFTYYESAKMFLSTGFTSLANNTYYTGLRISKLLVVKYDIGQGYRYTFLNGIRVFLYDSDSRKFRIVASRNFHCCIWDEDDVTHQTIMLVDKYLKEASNELRLEDVSDDGILHLSEKLVEEAVFSTKNILGCNGFSTANYSRF